MANLLYQYTDAFLKDLVTPSIEDAATEDINVINPDFPETWKSKLIVIRAYTIVCGENTVASGDLFHVKLTYYISEYNLALSNAIAAYNNANANSRYSYRTIPLERC